VLEFIGTNTSEHGHSPSMREIGDACGLSSSGSVKHVLDRLAVKGYIERPEGKPRSITVLRPAQPPARLVPPEPPMDGARFAVLLWRGLTAAQTATDEDDLDRIHTDLLAAASQYAEHERGRAAS
jgi:SOS-response transcriptional repressor LexA